MNSDPDQIEQLAANSKDFARLLLTIGENRIELLAVELQEERERLLRLILLALGVAAFALLAGITFTAGIVVLLRAWSPVTVLLTLTALYGVVAACLCHRLARRLRNEQPFSSSLDQLRKDRTCRENIAA